MKESKQTDKEAVKRLFIKKRSGTTAKKRLKNIPTATEISYSSKEK